MPTTDLAALLHAAGLSPQDAEEVSRRALPFILGYLSGRRETRLASRPWLWTVTARVERGMELTLLEQVIELVARESAAPGEPGEGGVGGD